MESVHPSIIDSIFVYTGQLTIIVMRNKERIGVNLAINPFPIRVGDSLWWSGKFAYWTPANNLYKDVPLATIL